MNKRLVYTVYKTVNKANGKFYLGVHKTSNPMDEYLGSGTYIKRAVAKYGQSGFTKEILFEYETQEEGWDKEDELIELNRNNPLCTNIRKGGSGGFDYINKNGLLTMSDETKARCTAKLLNWRKEHPNEIKENARIANLTRSKQWKGGKHTTEVCHRISEVSSGPHNNMHDKKWVHHPELGFKAVLLDEVQSYLDAGWLLGRIRYRKTTHSTYGKIWINNGERNKLVSNLEEFPGWKRGRLMTMIQRSFASIS